jgi:sec-independent protein translocase protein TatA
MFGLHMPELIIILVVALLIFGPKKLPEMGASIGKSIKEFRKGMNEISQPKDEKVVDVNVPNAEAQKREFLASQSASTELPKPQSSAVESEAPHSGISSSAVESEAPHSGISSSVVESEVSHSGISSTGTASE